MKCCILANVKSKVDGVPSPLVKICGVAVIVRILNSLRINDVRDVLIVVDEDTTTIRDFIRDGSHLGMRIKYAFTTTLKDIHNALDEFLSSDLIVIHGDVVIDPELISILTNMRGNVACYDNGEFLGICKFEKNALRTLGDRIFEEDLEKVVNSIAIDTNSIVKLNISSMEIEHEQLKRTISPICIRITDKHSVKIAKRTLIKRSQKGLHFTAYINKPIENALVSLVSDISWITPNRITILVNIAAFFVAFLFLRGYLVEASLLAYFIGILDGIDGKLSRVRGILTKLGHIEHSFDMLFEQTWYACYALGLYFLLREITILLFIPAILITDTFVRHIYMQFKQTSGKALTAYSRFDKLFAKIDGRRNIYVLYMIVFSLLGIPVYALYFILGHALLTAIVYSIRGIYHLWNIDKKKGTTAFLKMIGKP